MEDKSFPSTAFPRIFNHVSTLGSTASHLNGAWQAIRHIVNGDKISVVPLMPTAGRDQCEATRNSASRANIPCSSELTRAECDGLCREGKSLFRGSASA